MNGGSCTDRRTTNVFDCLQGHGIDARERERERERERAGGCMVRTQLPRATKNEAQTESELIPKKIHTQALEQLQGTDDDS